MGAGATVAGVIIWVVCLILNIYLAKKKNRSVAAWVVLSIFFSWIALIILAILRPLPPATAYSDGYREGFKDAANTGNDDDQIVQ